MRQNRPRRAKRLFNRALAKRERLPPNAWDVWIRLRVVVEGRHLGVHPDKVRAEFRTVLDVANRWSSPGMAQWFRRVQAQLDL